MNTITIGWESDDTQFRVEARPEGLWSEGPEITIVREYKGKRDRHGPSTPLDVVPDLIARYLNLTVDYKLKTVNYLLVIIRK